MTLNLKPCPFCGFTDPHLVEDDAGTWEKVVCPGCDARGPDRMRRYSTGTNSATAGWNTRTPPEASGIPSDDLRRLWNAEVDDADKLLTALGLGDKETISEQYRSEGGFLRVGKIVSALKERGIPHEPGVAWIAVTDRLPEWTEDRHAFVLVYSDSHDWQGTQFAVMRQSDFWDIDPEGDGEPGTDDARVVTHWRELRAPQTKSGEQT